MQDVQPLTRKQKNALDFIVDFSQKNGFSPSLKELAEFLETSNLSTAQYYVEQLSDKGYLRKNSHKSRGILPVTKEKRIKLLGYIAAGSPIEPIENPESITIPNDIKINHQFPHYALKVRGDSMIDMGILDGDTVLIQHQLFANNGDVVVAMTEQGATLKVLRKNKSNIYLEAKNKNFPNIYPKSLEIRGKFVGLLRSV